jgi:WD40 repeat protein/serine/threonine protein kinase
MIEEELFHRALEKPTLAEQLAFLGQVCAGQPEVRERVERLLRSHRHEDSFLKPDVTTDQPEMERPGMIIGPYKLLELIGEGGMGTVWMAEQTEPIHRRVAVKAIKAGMDSKQVLARFEAERQALALMDHPNIAKVLDAGAIPVGWAESSRPTDGARAKPAGLEDSARLTLPAGRPYFVMELVKGTPITKYCDDKHLSVRERLELFGDVCRAVQHAHQKGIIHRDIKPSNILVAPFDGKPVVKVIDFGVAKATGQRLTDATLFTGFGAIVGTPEYMSPEQAETNNQDIDTRSDIYSLGVLLYELLTGSTPLTKQRVKEAALLEVLRVIREEEPPKPSTRLSSTEELPSVAAQRQMEPAKLTKLVRGELDWIVMKALEKDRNRRYETANGFAMDVQRYLADEPVLACPPSVSYRLRKLVRRNKRAALAGSLIVIALVGGIVGTTLGLVRARTERDNKEKAREAEAGQRAAAEASLYRSLVSESRALLLSGREGWRARALENLRHAAQIDTPERDQVELRTDAVAVLAGSDVGTVATVESSRGMWSMDFSPDSARLAVAGTYEVVVWDLRQGGLRRERAIPLPGASEEGQFFPGAPFPCVSFHPDGKQFAFNTWDRAVDFQALAGAATLPRLTAPVQPRSIAFARQGKVFAVSWINGHLGVHDAATGERLRSLSVDGAGQGFVRMPVVLSPDGGLLATVGARGTIELHDLRTSNPPRVLGQHANKLGNLCFSGDGRLLAAASDDKTAKIWNVRGGDPVTLRGHTTYVHCVALSPDGELAATGGNDLMVRLWDTRTGQGIMTLPRRHHVLSLAFSPDGTYLAAAGHESVSLYRLEKRRERRRWLDINYTVFGLDFHPRQGLVAVGCADQTLTIRGLDSGRIVRTLRANNNQAVGRVAFSPDGTLVAAGNSHFYNSRATDHDVPVWNAVTAEVFYRLKGHEGDVTSVGFDPSGERLAAAGADGMVIVWQLRSGKPLIRWRGPGCAAAVRFLAAGTRLIVWYASGTVELRDANDGRVLRQTDGLEGRRDFDESVPAMAVSPDERHLAIPCRDGTVRILSLPDLAVMRTVADAHRGFVQCTAFSPDGRWFASAGEDRTVVLRDGRTFERLFAFPPHDATVLSLEFGRHSSHLALAGEEQQVTLWDLDRIVAGLAEIGLAWKGAARPGAPAPDSDVLPELIPTGGAAHFKAGNELRAQGRIEEYIEEYEKGIALDPNNVEARWALTNEHCALGNQHRKSGDVAAAKVDYARAGVHMDEIAGSLAARAKACADNPDWRRDIAASYVRLGASCEHAGLTQKAKSAYLGHQTIVDKLATDYPKESLYRKDQIWIRQTLGRLLGAADRTKDAEALFSEALSVAENLVADFPQGGSRTQVAGLRQERGQLRARLVQFREAAADFAEASRLNPDDLSAQYYRGVALLAVDDFDGLRKVCDATLRLFDKPDLTGIPTWWVIAVCMLAPNPVADVELLVRVAEFHASKNAGSWYALMELGGAYYRAGQFEKSIRSMESACKMHQTGGNAYNWLFLAMAHQRLGHGDEGRRWLERATGWLEKAATEKLKDPFNPTPLTWNDRVVLTHLRHEAEGLILGNPKPEPKKDGKK